MKVNGIHRQTVWFEDGELKMVNQPLLPHSFEIVTFTDYVEVADAIRAMVVRGAPAIGATGAFAMALAEIQSADLDDAASLLKSTRPTAQDLFYAVDAVRAAAANGAPALDAAQDIADAYVIACKAIGEHGAALIQNGMRLNTHCNAGWLATVDWGTALAPMYMAAREGKKISVFVDETRPRCQGSRITAFELGEEGIPHAVIVDSAAGYYMWRGEIDMVIVGADRVAINGDIANKIGTYSSAVAAKENGIPFYVAAPLATIDPGCERGEDIPIEERNDREVSHMFGWDEERDAAATVRIAPVNSSVRNPAFDVTPAKLISGIITERGVFPAERIRDALESR